jgi:di/tricarboxylate transporter
MPFFDIAVIFSVLLGSLALCIASTACRTPLGHRANTMFTGLGKDRFRDFTRVGSPRTLLVLVVARVPIPNVSSFTKV